MASSNHFLLRLWKSSDSVIDVSLLFDVICLATALFTQRTSLNIGLEHPGYQLVRQMDVWGIFFVAGFYAYSPLLRHAACNDIWDEPLYQILGLFSS